MEELNVVQKITVWAIPLLFAITLHEVAHGWVANMFGDHTAKLSGRLTINPLKHIDIVGTVIVPIVLLVLGGFIFGWAKPVPVNPRNISRPRIEMPLISLAGPMSNFLMALFWAGIAKCGYLAMAGNPWLGEPLTLMGEAGISINIILAVLNCIPIPPLDGGRALSYLLPGRAGWLFGRIEPYGFFILILLIATGALSYVIGPLYVGLYTWIATLFGLV
jgi:Zn-dependent protease